MRRALRHTSETPASRSGKPKADASAGRISLPLHASCSCSGCPAAASRSTAMMARQLPCASPKSRRDPARDGVLFATAPKSSRPEQIAALGSYGMDPAFPTIRSGRKSRYPTRRSCHPATSRPRTGCIPYMPVADDCDKQEEVLRAGISCCIAWEGVIQEPWGYLVERGYRRCRCRQLEDVKASRPGRNP